MKKRPQGNAGAACGTSRDYHVPPTHSTLDRVELPKGISGLDAASSFDLLAVASGLNTYLREIIPGEFEHLPDLRFYSQGKARPATEEERQALERYGYEQKRVTAIRQAGNIPMVLVVAQPDGAISRMIVHARPQPEGVSA